MRKDAVTRRPRRRTLAMAMLMVAAATGATATGIVAANAAEPAHFVAIFTPTKTDPRVGGNGVAPTFEEAEKFAMDGLKDLCTNAGYGGLAPGVRTNAAAARDGQTKNPEGNIVFTANGTCIEAGAPPVNPLDAVLEELAKKTPR